MKRRPVRTASTMIAAAFLLSACGVGQNSQTYQYKAQANSTNANAGLLMALRNVHVVAVGQGEAYEQGEDAPVEMVLVNSSTTDDVLESVTSSAAASVELRGAEGPFVVPGGQSVLDYTLQLVGLTRPLNPAEFVDITFTFENAGTVEVSVPVRTSYEEPEIEPFDVTETGSDGQPLDELEEPEGPVGGVEGTAG